MTMFLRPPALLDTELLAPTLSRLVVVDEPIEGKRILMSKRSDNRRRYVKKSRRLDKAIREWEEQYPGTWILLEVTEADDGDPVRGKLITTARDLDDFQKIWKSHRKRGVLTMVTYGPPLEPGPAVVV
jgi:hypothetical protein